MELVRHGAPAAVLPLPGGLHGGAPPRAREEDGVGGSRSAAGGAVRADLGEVFRREYLRVVGVAARVLGSRDSAEDVAQEVFLSFGRSSVPAGEAGGWLTVAATHTALNLLRSGRRRSAREEAADDGPMSSPTSPTSSSPARNAGPSGPRSPGCRTGRRPRWYSGTAA
ncbi:MAG: hypothetical protein M3Q47_15720 [Actinomycetota bacterium]|nr:hypothetical protein [Actinomycetota bacterium]